MGTRAGHEQSALRARSPRCHPVDPTVAADTWLVLGAVRSHLPRLDHLSADGIRDRGRLARTVVCLNSIAEVNHELDRQAVVGVVTYPTAPLPMLTDHPSNGPIRETPDARTT